MQSFDPMTTMDYRNFTNADMEQFEMGKAFVSAGMSSSELKGSYSIIRLIAHIKTTQAQISTDNRKMLYSLAQTVAEIKNAQNFEKCKTQSTIVSLNVLQNKILENDHAKMGLSPSQARLIMGGQLSEPSDFINARKQQAKLHLEEMYYGKNGAPTVTVEDVEP